MDIQTQFYSLLAQMEMNEVLDTALDMEDMLPCHPPPCANSAQAMMVGALEDAATYTPPPSYEAQGFTQALKIGFFRGFANPLPPPPPPPPPPPLTVPALYGLVPHPHTFIPYGPGWGPGLVTPVELGCCKQEPMENLPRGPREKPLPYGFKAEGVVPGPPAGPATPGSPSANVCTPQKRKPENHVLGPYIKKPPNAFMIYRQEQGPLVSAEINNTWCAAVNKVIGQRWRAMSKQQQAKYYQAAAIEKKHHSDLYPGWSSRENYGRKRRRNQRRLHTADEV